MKLYNKTAVPDSIMVAVVRAAAKMLRPSVRHGEVVVKVTRARERVSGCATPGFFVHRSDLLGQWDRRGNDIEGTVKTDCGWITIRIPKAGDRILWDAHTWREPLYIAERFFWMCLHEWGHITDNQHNVKCRQTYDRTESRRFGQYNRRWENRPHERRAVRYEKEAKERGLTPEAEDAILALALWLEEESDG